MDTNTISDTISAAFDQWRDMNAEVPALNGKASEEQCERIGQLEQRMLTLPVASLADLWLLVAATMDPPEAGDFTTEALLARRARLEAGLPANR